MTEEARINSTSTPLVRSIATGSSLPDPSARALRATVTLTADPSIDRAYAVDHLCHGAVLRTRSVRVEAGGRSLNVQSTSSYRIGFGRSLTR